MAAVAAEDDEAWLYGESGKPDPAPPGTEPVVGLTPPAKPADREAGEVLSGEEGESKKVPERLPGDDDDDEDDDSEDDVQVTIGDLKPQPYEASKFKTGYQRPSAQSSVSKTQTQPKGVDIETPGTINGVNVYEFDLDSLQSEEKPWRKPGADITDYFNYGFTEDTWMKYCERQRRLRSDNNAPHLSGPPKSYAPTFRDREHNRARMGDRDMTPKRSDSKTEQPMTIDTTEAGGAGGPLSPGRRAGPPPGRKFAGTIDVIGSTTNDSRRPARDFQEMPPTASAEAQDFKKYPVLSTATAVPTPSGLPPMNMPPPDFSTPPPGMGATNMPPPGAPILGPPPMGPPPNTGVPPPNMGGPPPGFPPPPVPADPYESFYPPGHAPPPVDRGPPMGYDDRPPYGFGPPGPYGPMSNSGPPPWDSRPGDGYNRGGWNYGQGPPHPDSEFSSSDDERDRRYHDGGPPRDFDSRENFRGRERSRSRERERRHRERDRERDRGRDRDTRERERERERDRDREDRHSRSRRKREDDDHHRSKHKKSKRSKRDRDDEGGGEEASSQNDDTQAA